MKKKIGLDIGTTSIGWALINQAETETEQSEIVASGVRVMPLSTDEESDFQKGKAATINSNRTLKRGMRRNLDRYQDRRARLIDIMKKSGWIDDQTILTESGKQSTHELWSIRAKAASEKIEIEEFARVLLAINKKRGYKSNRKAQDEGDGQAIDGMDLAKRLYDEELTPGQYVLELLENGKKSVPDFYRSDLKAEFTRIWDNQCQWHEEMKESLRAEIEGKNSKATWAILEQPWSLVGIQKGNSKEKKIEAFRWRVAGLTEKLTLEQLAVVFQRINSEINASSGYLGAISDRSKELIFKKLTIGQYLHAQLLTSPHNRLKSQVFYRQDYLDEFEQIWETQSTFHPSLSPALKTDIRDAIIFFQRRLKSQKGLLSICELEGKKRKIQTKEGKNKNVNYGPKVCPKSSPLFQEFRIWQLLNNLQLKCIDSEGMAEETGIDGMAQTSSYWELDHAMKQRLFSELNTKEKMSSNEILKFLGLKPKQWELNFKEGLVGNKTNAAIFHALESIIDLSGHEVNLTKKSGDDRRQILSQVLATIGIDPNILEFDSTFPGKAFEKQSAYIFWHLLYSYEGDEKSRSGNEALKEKLHERFGIAREYAEPLIRITFEQDHASLSTKAMRKLMPHMQNGMRYDQACEEVGYRHSNWLSKDENLKRELVDKLEILPKNSLRNPVVEKILNQMIHVVNGIIATHGRPEEIVVELARDLKKSAKERAESTQAIGKANKEHELIRKKIALLHPFNTGVRITRNDIIKYKLYEELAGNGYKTLYTGTEIKKEKLYSNEYDIEHIIPKALLFDDSFSNKTLAVRDVNLKKGKETAMDYMVSAYGEDSLQVKQYMATAEKLFKKEKKSKYIKLLKIKSEIPDGFIERDLRNTQYISKKAVEILSQVVRTVHTTTGKVTDKLRHDWQLIDVLKELNWDKYEQLGLTHVEKNKHGQDIKQIKEWSKRNDHRHHAMDAITVAFTRPSHIQYLNYKSARADEQHTWHAVINKIEAKETFLDQNKNRLFKPPMGIHELRAAFKTQLEALLVSFKTKNKVLTRNVNKTKTKHGLSKKIEQTPRGQMHKETVYGRKKHYVTKEEKIGPKFNSSKIQLVADRGFREALMKRLVSANGDPKKAFGGKNALSKNPLYLSEQKTEQIPEKVKLVWLEKRFTIRKEISPDLKVEKVIDKGCQRILQTRLDTYGGNPKVAFANLDENPIWMSQEKGIKLKRVTITGVSNAEPLHHKHDHLGKMITDEEGKLIPTDFVQTGNNHHVAIYRDEKGNLQEKVVSFFEAVTRKKEGLHAIDHRHNADLGWEFLFSMKQNEMFVFPNEERDFDPSSIDLMDPANYSRISPHLFRVQKFTNRDYFFRNHLETKISDSSLTKGHTWIRTGLAGLNKIIKLRINHIGEIVHVGEY